MTSPGAPPLPADERRRDFRHPLRVRGVAEDKAGAGTEFFDVLASDISERGMLLHSDREELFIPYGHLALVFTPTGDGEAVQLQVQIEWMHRNPSVAKQWSIGCSFIQTPLASIHLLVDRAQTAEANAGPLFEPQISST